MATGALAFCALLSGLVLPSCVCELCSGNVEEVYSCVKLRKIRLLDQAIGNGTVNSASANQGPPESTLEQRALLKTLEDVDVPLYDDLHGNLVLLHSCI